jgi:hypothetical protein
MAAPVVLPRASLRVLLREAAGWPIPRGGSVSLTVPSLRTSAHSAASCKTEAPVDSLDEFPYARAVLLDVTPRQLLRLDGTRLSALYRLRLEHFQYGLGTFKID